MALAFQVNLAAIWWGGWTAKGWALGVLKEIDWDDRELELAGSQELYDQEEAALDKFFMTHTKKELKEGALARDVLLAPVLTIEDILNSSQLASRGYWDKVEHAELGATITYPGAFIKASETPCMKIIRAPLIGEQNEEVYSGELEISREELVVLKGAKVI